MSSSSIIKYIIKYNGLLHESGALARRAAAVRRRKRETDDDYDDHITKTLIRLTNGWHSRCRYCVGKMQSITVQHCHRDKSGMCVSSTFLKQFGDPLSHVFRKCLATYHCENYVQLLLLVKINPILDNMERTMRV